MQERQDDNLFIDEELQFIIQLQVNIINNKIASMPKPKPTSYQYFPLQQLQRIVQQQRHQKRQLVSKKIVAPRPIVKNHSKSLYYCSNFNRNLRPVILNSINRTGVHQITSDIHLANHQTLNQELLAVEKPKPQTSHYSSGRNTAKGELRSNKISLRSSSNYNWLSSVAGVRLNERESKDRMLSNMNTRANVRNGKMDEIRKENKRLSERLESQQSQYETKKLLKAYQSHERISRRLTDSKMSRRSNSIQDNRSVCSQKSSRQSVKSRSSQNSQTSSMKSTSRANSSNLSSRNKTANRLQAKFTTNKKIKIEEHNINKLSEDEFSKFKKMFGNSFSTTKNEKTSNQHKPSNLAYEKMLTNNPYADVQVMSQKSQASAKSIKKNSYSNSRGYNLSVNTSNKKLRQGNFDTSNANSTVQKKSSVITSDGLLHRIAEEMYTVKQTGMTDDITSREVKKKKDSVQTDTKSFNYHQSKNLRQFAKSTKRKETKGDFNYSILPTNLVFGKV